MKSLDSFFNNCFKVEYVSNGKFAKFAFDHYQRLIANNEGGVYDNLIQATQLKYELFTAVLSSTDQHFTLQQSRTKTVDVIMEDFVALTRRFSNYAKSLFGEASAEYEEYFPHGLTEYSFCNKTTVQLLLARLSTSVENHKEEVGAKWANDFAALQQSYLHARNAQEESKGTVAGQRGLRNQQRDELAEQLYKNLLTITLNNIGKPEMAKVFFEESMLKIRSKKGAVKIPLTGIISGTLTDGGTGLPIEAASVSVEGTTIAGTTDEDGDFYLEGIQPGNYSLMFKCTGYIDLQYPNVAVKAGEEAEIEAEMTK